MKQELKKPNIDRLLAVMRRQKADRVPNFEDIITERVVNAVLEKKTGCSSNRDLPVRDAMKLAQRTGQDAIMRVGDAWPSVKGGFCDWSDIEQWKAPDLTGFHARLEEDVKALEGSGIGLGLNLCGSFFTTYMEVGPVQIQDFMLKLYDDRPFIETLMDQQLDLQMKKVEMVMDLPIHFFNIADDVCANNGFLCSPAIMAELWVPRIRKLVDRVKQKGVPVMWHCCGKLDQVLPYLVEWEIDCINPIQTSCNDIVAIKKKYGDKIALRGNLDIEGVLAFGTPDDVRREARHLIDTVGYDGGYILASSHSITEAIPPDNYRAMVETAWESGY